MNETDALAKAQEMVKKRKREEFIESFENGSRKETDSLRVNTKDGAEFYYGIAALEDGKLVGFDIMSYSKVYMDGRGYSFPESPYTDKDGKQVRLSVDEYLKFQDDIKAGDTRLGVLLEKADEMAEIQAKKNEIIGQSRVAEGLALLKNKREGIE